jgi:hypothetical protein
MAVFDPTTPDEVWYPVPRFPAQEISSHFRIRSWFLPGSRGKLALVPTIREVQMNRYPSVVARRDDGVLAPIYLHHVIAEMIYGPCPDGLQVLHSDDDKHNLDPANLYYGTPKRNALDRVKNGRTRKAKGEDNSNVILTEDDVREIRRLRAIGWKRRQIAEKFHVATKTVDGIVSGKRWPHVF